MEFDYGDAEPTLESAIFQALGAASMCWDPKPYTQIFDSTAAKEIGDALLAEIEKIDICTYGTRTH